MRGLLSDRGIMKTTDVEQDRVGTFQFTIATAEDTPESRRRWEGRIDALTDWLVYEWQRSRCAKTPSQTAERN
jgi:hypothetical protein